MRRPVMLLSTEPATYRYWLVGSSKIQTGPDTVPSVKPLVCTTVFRLPVEGSGTKPATSAFGLVKFVGPPSVTYRYLPVESV